MLGEVPYSEYTKSWNKPGGEVWSGCRTTGEFLSKLSTPELLEGLKQYIANQALICSSLGCLV